MDMLTRFVGLDYHQNMVQVCVMDSEGNILVNRACENDWQKIAETLGERQELFMVRAAVEACCGAADLAEELVEQAGWAVSLAHPGIVARMKQNPDKTDYSDARLLSDLMRVGYLPRVWLAPQEVRELRRLVRFRQQLVNQRRATKLRIRALLREHRIKCDGDCRAWTKGWLAWLEQNNQLPSNSRWIMDRQLATLKRFNGEIKEVERQLQQMTEKDAVISKLLTYSGIGPITAFTLRAEIGHFDRFQNGKQLARFCGLSPQNASSGDRQADAGLIKAANRQLRAVLIEAAQRLIHHDERWTRMAQHLLAKGKRRNVVTAAVANRWIRWLYHQMQPEQLAA